MKEKGVINKIALYVIILWVTGGGPPWALFCWRHLHNNDNLTPWSREIYHYWQFLKNVPWASLTTTTSDLTGPQSQVYVVMIWEGPEDSAEQNFEIQSDKNWRRWKIVVFKQKMYFVGTITGMNILYQYSM